LPFAHQFARERSDVDGARLQQIACLLERRLEAGDQQLFGPGSGGRAGVSQRVELVRETLCIRSQRRICN